MNQPNNQQPSIPPADPESGAVQNYLNILQGIISRMANNSGNCKTWCITLVSALLVVIVDKGKINYVWIALIPIVLFGFLDAYYLGLERAFCETYNDFVKRMHAGNAPITDVYKVIPPRGFSAPKYTFGALLSFAVYPFYITLIGMTVLAYILINP